MRAFEGLLALEQFPARIYDDELIVAVEDLQSLPKTDVDPELEARWRDLAKKRWGMAVEIR